MKIYLIGMPASGKSTTARQLSKEMNLPLIDLDFEIERKEGKSISEIFNKHGEEYFRKLEQSMLRELSEDHRDFVMATGGGAACFFDNIEVMNAFGITIFINTPFKDILSRLKGKGREHRPLVNKMEEDSFELELKRKWEKRSPFYQKAKLTYSPESDTPGLVELIYNYQK